MTAKELAWSMVKDIPIKPTLTDEEIIELRQTTKANNTSNWADTLAFARAILRKAQEK